MRSLTYLLLPLFALLLVGCRSGEILITWKETDAYYEGWVDIDRPGLVFDHSFRARLRIYDGNNRARLWDNRGRVFESEWVDYSSWDDRVTIFFMVRESGWDPDCGYETYDWELRMRGRIYSDDHFCGELVIDIDPENYYSDYCYMDYNPPPKHLGSFDLYRDYNCPVF